MSKLFALLVLFAAPCGAFTNQLEFDYGRGLPQSSLQLGNNYQAEGDRGPEWSANWLHPVGGRLMVGIGGGHFHSHENVSPGMVSNASSALTSRTTSILLLGRINLPTPQSKAVWYSITGIGWARNTLTLIATPTSPWADTGTSESRTYIDEGQDTLAVMQGLGLDIPLFGKFFVGGEVRYQASLRKDFNLTPAGVAATGLDDIRANLNLLLLSLKAGIRY